MKISVVVPVYGCPEALKPLCERAIKTIKKITNNYEIVLVNDCCPKGSWNVIKELCKIDKNIKGINFSRNFGQVHSTNAGIKYASGDYIVLMDCDLQDRPEGIIDLYNEIVKGYDIVFSKRKDRKDTAMTLFLSRMFYKIYNCFIDGKFDGDIGNLCIVNRKVVDEYINIKDNNKSFINYLFWMGFKSSTIDIEGDERYEGKSSYSFSKKLNLAIETITSQSNKPLKMLVKFGFVVASLGFIFLLIQVALYFINKNVMEGWTSIIASIFAVGGLILMSLGGIGIYVGNIFDQSRGKPEYIVNEILNNENSRRR